MADRAKARADAWRTAGRYRLWPWALLYSVPAIVAMLRNQPGTYVGDNRFEQYWGPGWRIVRETMLWDGTRGMGRVGEEFWPITVPFALLRSLGLSPAATQHTWHAVLLVLGGLGALNLVRVFQPRIGGAHVLAGLAYMCNPFSVTFLVPSNLYWNYVLTPWLLAAALQGIRATDDAARWRWAAIWAALIFTAGDTDLPGLVFAVLWAVPAAVCAVHVERWATWRDVRRWLVRAVPLTLAVSAAALVKVVLGAGALGQRLLYTETPLQVNHSSSWTESFRGLGYWLSYFSTPGRDTDVPGGLHWYESAGGVLITFLLPVLALVALWRLRWRTRLLLMAIALPSLVLMVGSYRPDRPTPSGRLLLATYRTVPSLSSFRNTYKAGAGLTLAVCILVAVGASALGTWVARRGEPWMRPVGAGVLVIALGLASLPFWNGGLYPPDRQMQDIPDHWRAAAAWVEAQPGDARVLVLPGSTQTAYRWGWAGDDILDTLFRRHPNVVPTNFPISGTITANIIDAIERRAAEGTLTAEMLMPIAQRLGVGWVLLRNDLDWERIREPRPAVLDPLRGTRVLPLARTFGRPGDGTTDPTDRSATAAAERELPPIELYRVPGSAGGQDLTRSDVPPLVVDGDGGAWPTLAERGAMAHGRPLRFAGAASDAAVADVLDHEGSLVVTDTNRRRLTLIRGPGPTSSETLADRQVLAQPPEDLFAKPGTQSVTTYPDAVEISSSGSGSDLIGFTASLRPSNAFDGLATTAWRDGGLADPVGVWIKVRFATAHDLSEVTLQPWISNAGRSPSRASLHFDDGSSVSVALPKGQETVTVRFSRRSTSSLTVRVDAVRGKGTAPVGFTDIVVPGVDLQEYVAVPTHLFTSTEPALRKAMATEDVSYLFRRSLGVAGNPEELRLRRQFPVAGRRAWRLTARLNPTEPPADRIVDQLVGGTVGAYGSSRVGLPSQGRGALAVDGDPTSAWAGRPRAGESLTVHFPRQAVDRVRVTVAAGPGDYPAQQLVVKVGQGSDHLVTLAADPACTTGQCPRTATFSGPTATTGRVQVTLADGDGGGRPVRIAEVAVDGPDGAVAPAAPPVAGACSSGVVAVDGRPVRLRSAGPILPALDRGAVRLVGCDSLSLAPTTHRLSTTASARVDEVALTLTDVRSTPATAATMPTARVVRRDPTAITLAVRAPTAGLVLTGQSYDPAWTASADGRSLGRPIEVEGQSAWRIPAGVRVVHLRYAPQRWYAVALTISGAALAACAVLILRRPRRREPDATRQ